MENYLLDGFKKQIDANVKYSPDIVHASDVERNSINVSTMEAPYV